ncbi:MAG TPA: hypothetical protein VHF06_34845 [Pseudonocardiaceae bacterium]|jgi:hypothetical protein|nr:hypothetical protein [Pseudonocardiaceae bacterium]
MLIRPGVPDDREFVEDMVAAAANWRRDHDRAETLADPHVAHYVEGWPRTTDITVVAMDGNPRGNRVRAILR